jgi:hypothetical protein
MVRRVMLLLSLAVFSVVAACAQIPPNLTGKWKLNVAKSEFGSISGPDSRTDEIVKNGLEIKQSVVSEGPQGPQD